MRIAHFDLWGIYYESQRSSMWVCFLVLFFFNFVNSFVVVGVGDGWLAVSQGYLPFLIQSNDGELIENILEN